MKRSQLEISSVIKNYGAEYRAHYCPNNHQLTVLNALQQCRTGELGGHKDQCDNKACSHDRFSYNSCGNRHCPKCQIARQMLWAEDRMLDALKVKHYHLVFTVPEALNELCLLDSKAFYEAQFDAVWQTLQSFGYTHYGVETGAICVLHTWGQNLSLHPHIHCIVPAAGLSVRGEVKTIGKEGKYLYSVHQLSTVFRGKLLERLKQNLKKSNQLTRYQSVIDQCYAKPWVVYCEPSLGDAQQVVAYLGQYTHRVAITNRRIKNINEQGVTFSYKDYKNKDNQKLMTLDGVEFLRRFAMHILPKRFVKIRYYGILTSKYKQQVKSLKQKPDFVRQIETKQQRMIRLTGYDPCRCPKCKTGMMQIVVPLPRIRSPDNVFFARTENINR